MAKKFLTLFIMIYTVVALGVYADDTVVKNGFYFNQITQIPHMRHVGFVEMGENQSSITLEFAEVSNPCSNYYISLYNMTNEDEGYILKFAGPIKTDKFTFTGLESGTQYRVSLSSAVNIENANGVIYAH